MLHNFIGITGRFGSGKSLYAVEWGLELANRFQKNLVVNFPLDQKAVKLYCKAKGLKWFLRCGRVIQIDVYNDLLELFHIPNRSGSGFTLNRNSVTIFDEGGIAANSRSWASISKEFYKYLFQLRKLDVHLLLIFQFEEQVDKQFRLTIQRWCVCKSSGFYDKKLRKPRILSRLVYHYDPEKFLRLQENHQARGNMILPWLWSETVHFAFPVLDLILYGLLELWIKILFAFGRGSGRVPLSPTALLFKCFKSGALVGGIPPAPPRINRLYSPLDYEVWSLSGGQKQASNLRDKNIKPLYNGICR